MRRRALVVPGAALAARARVEAAPSTGAGFAASAPGSSPLRIALMPHSSDERLVFHDGIARHREARPDARSEVRPLPPDTFKATLREHLAHDPDVADLNDWFAGARLAELASAGLLAPLDGLWRDEHLDEAFGASLQRAVSFRGRAFAAPRRASRRLA